MRDTPPNNSFNRSASSGAFMRETWLVSRLCLRPVNSGVRQQIDLNLAGAYDATSQQRVS